MRLIADTFAFCRDEVPRWNTISVSGYHIREAGSDAVQEVAFTLADGIAYVEAARAAGLDVDEFAPRLSFFFNAHAQPARGGREVPRRAAAVGAHHARALRRAATRRSLMLRFHAQTGGLDADRAAAAEQRRAHDGPGAGRRAGRRAVAAHQRLRRGAGAAHRGVGARWRCARSRSWRTRAGVADVVDPLGGSYAVEALTQRDRGARRALHRRDRRDGRHGGGHRSRVPAARDRAARLRAPARHRDRRAHRRGPEPVRRRPERRQRARRAAAPAGPGARATRRWSAWPRRVRARTPGGPRARCAALGERRARAGEPAAAASWRAVKARATLGEIADALRGVFGEHRAGVNLLRVPGVLEVRLIAAALERNFAWVHALRSRRYVIRPHFRSRPAGGMKPR